MELKTFNNLLFKLWEHGEDYLSEDETAADLLKTYMGIHNLVFVGTKIEGTSFLQYVEGQYMVADKYANASPIEHLETCFEELTEKSEKK